MFLRKASLCKIVFLKVDFKKLNWMPSGLGILMHCQFVCSTLWFSFPRYTLSFSCVCWSLCNLFVSWPNCLPWLSVPSKVTAGFGSTRTYNDENINFDTVTLALQKVAFHNFLIKNWILKEIFFLLTANLGIVLLIHLYSIHMQSDLPPLRPISGEAPGRDSNPGRADLEAGTPTSRPPHLTIL